MKIEEYAKKINQELKKEQLKQFETYMNLLLEWNEKINLTAITDPEEIILKHFIDSLTISSYISKNSKVIDVGTGAGFPGIPLKIAREDTEVTLLDSLQKRVHFLEEVIDKLELKKITAIHARAEEQGKNKNMREKYDIATSRAVANLATLAEYLLPFVKLEGYAICMKGPDVDEEIKQSQNAISILGGKIEKVEKFFLPDSDIGRSIILIKKIKTTPAKYPRKAGMPSKEPIR